jgi:hypothetical protein
VKKMWKKKNKKKKIIVEEDWVSKLNLKIEYLLPYTGSRKVLENIPENVPSLFRSDGIVWNSLRTGSQGELRACIMTNEFEYLHRNVRFSKYGMTILIWCCLQLSCKLNLDRAN